MVHMFMEIGTVLELLTARVRHDDDDDWRVTSPGI